MKPFTGGSLERESPGGAADVKGKDKNNLPPPARRASSPTGIHSLSIWVRFMSRSGVK